jgi:heat shock protein 4
VDVVKKKKRTKRTDIPVVPSGLVGLADNVISKRMDEETALQVEMKEIQDTDEKRNDLEGYIFTMRDKIDSSGEYGAFIADGDRDKFSSELTAMEDWLYDAEDATKLTYIDKLDELKKTGDPVVWRFKESQIRDEWISALSGTISNYKAAAENPGDKYGHIDAEKLAKVTKECDTISAWLTDLQGKQGSMPKYERPVLICADMEKKNQELAKFADEILKEPKPKPVEPPKEEKPADEAKDEAPKEDNMDVDENGKKDEEPAAAPNMDVD